MPDLIDATGLTVKTRDEIVDGLKESFRSIYGADINVDQNSPDGQLINILGQALVEVRELLVTINTTFDPDHASGSILDTRVAINNIERIGGTFTIQPVSITVTQNVTLAGLDGAFNDINGTGYTVQDDAGTQFILIDTVSLTPGTYSLPFRAKTVGQVETTVNTITNPVTVVLGVTTINNPLGAQEVGQREETDAQLRVRRQQSVALSSTGYLNGLLGEILNLDGVTDARLFENVTNVTDADGIPAHGIWLIVQGGSSADIGNAIYGNKSYGANMKGAQTYTITTASGALFVAKFDRATAQALYIRFNIQKTVVGATFDTAVIKTYIQTNLTYTINQAAETSRITAVALAAIQSTVGNGVPVDVEVSADGSTWVDYLATTTKDRQFTVSTANIAVTVLP